MSDSQFIEYTPGSTEPQFDPKDVTGVYIDGVLYRATVQPRKQDDPITFTIDSETGEVSA